MAESASNNTLSLKALADIKRLEFDSINVGQLFIVRFKHFTMFFSLNMTE